MKKNGVLSVLTMLALCLAVAFTGCSSGGGSDSAGCTAINVTSDITSATTWTAGSVYIVDQAITIRSDLTIEPGTVVKFTPAGSLYVYTGATVHADGGSAATPIVFTSIKDDSACGDTNGDGSATTPARGDWSYVSVISSGSIFNYCRFSYGGGNMPYTGTLSLSSNSTTTVTNSTFAHNKGGTLTDTRAAALNAGNAGAGTVLAGNAFYDNDVPLVINGKLNLDNTDTFHYLASAGSATITNTYNGIFMDSVNYTITGDISWSSTDAPYVLSDTSLSIPSNASLTLGDGVIVKFGQGRGMSVNGALIADGSNRIVFTSLKDDTYGGDTNGDGNATMPAHGDWYGVWTQTGSSKFNHCLFMYAGSGKPYQGALDVGGTTAGSVTNCTFAHNSGGTLTDTRASALFAGNAAAGTVITGNTFYDNDVPLTINALLSLDNSNVFHSLASGGTSTITNTYNGIFMDGVHYTVTGDITWSNTEAPYVINIGQTFSVAQGASLTLGNNVVLKFGSSKLYLNNSTLNQGTGTFFTSLQDDELLGDTNGDGSATSPVKGDWLGIQDCTNSCLWEPWGNILYATNP